MQKDHLQKAALKDMQDDVVRTMVKERVNLHVHKKLSDVAGRDLPPVDDQHVSVGPVTNFCIRLKGRTRFCQ